MMAERTLEAMARGGMYDQLGGGFARYSVDERWEVPHFEKMLYDNALLLRVYAHWARQEGSELADRVARETADFMLRELRTLEGGFASALDADTDGAEGELLRLDAAPAHRCPGAAGGRRRRLSCSRVSDGGQLRARGLDAAADPRPRRLGAITQTSYAGCWTLGPSAPARRATTRSLRPGTAWRSRHWSRHR